MRKVLLLLGASVVLSACAVQPDNTEFCNDLNGKNTVRIDKSGKKYGVCVLKDRTEVNDWYYYREVNPVYDCDLKATPKLIGKNLTDEEIMSRTNSKFIRNVPANERVITHQLPNRVSVTKNNSGKIIRATCG